MSNFIKNFAFGNFTDTVAWLVFLSDGSIVGQTSGSGAQTLAPAGTIDFPHACGVSQWAGQYMLIAAPQLNTNGYYVWDGTNFYQPGSLGPVVTMLNDGLDYTSAPTVAAWGGSGSGATFTPIIANNGVVNVTVTNPGSGYGVNDYVILTFTGGGSKTTATATASISGGAVSAINVSNSGTGYTSTSLVALKGGGGFGATATASASGGHITSITVVSGGDGYSTPPTVIITDANNPVAVATVLPMPFGVSGTTIEVFQSRVWISNGHGNSPPPQNQILFTAPGNPIDFLVTDGAGAFDVTDSFLRIGVHGMKQSNGFLYLIGDSSVGYISGVNTSGTPPVTTFNYQNLDPQIGSPWPLSVTVFSRSIVFANSFGVFVLNGGAAQKISLPLDGFYSTVDNNNLDANVPLKGGTPSVAVATIFGIHVFMLLLPIIDPYTGLERNALCMWDGRKWWLASQTPNLIQIATQEVNSVITAYGTDGLAIYPLFQTPNNMLQKVARSRFWYMPGIFGFPRPMRCYGLLQNNAADWPVLNLFVDTESGSVEYDAVNVETVTWINNSGNAVQWQNNLGNIVQWVASNTPWWEASVENYGVLNGMTLTTYGSDCTVVSNSMISQLHDFRT